VLLTGSNLFLPFAWDLKSGSPQRRRTGDFTTLREIQSSPELAERLDCGDFSTAFIRAGNIRYSSLSARPTAPLKPAHSKRFARFGHRRENAPASWTVAALRLHLEEFQCNFSAAWIKQ
jgi:hypothetical protein